MEHIKQLREQLLALIPNLREGDVDHKIGKEMINAAGKVINTLKVEIDYAAARKEQPNISYLNNAK